MQYNYTYQDLHHLNEKRLDLIEQLEELDDIYQGADRNSFVFIEGIPYNHVEYLESCIFGVNSYLGSILKQIDEAEYQLGLVHPKW